MNSIIKMNRKHFYENKLRYDKQTGIIYIYKYYECFYEHSEYINNSMNMKERFTISCSFDTVSYIFML